MLQADMVLPACMCFRQTCSPLLTRTQTLQEDMVPPACMRFSQTLCPFPPARIRFRQAWCPQHACASGTYSLPLRSLVSASAEFFRSPPAWDSTQPMFSASITCVQPHSAPRPLVPGVRGYCIPAEPPHFGRPGPRANLGQP